MQYSFASRAQTLLSSRRAISGTCEAGFFISLAEEPAEELFPLHSLAEAATSVRSEDPLALHGREAEGYGPAREWLSEDFSRRKGLSVQPQRYSADHGHAQRPSICWSGVCGPGRSGAGGEPHLTGLLQVPRSPRCRHRASGGRSRRDVARAPGGHDPAKTSRSRYGRAHFTNPTGVMWSLERRQQVLELYLAWTSYRRTILTAIFILRTPRIRSPEFLPSH